MTKITVVSNYKQLQVWSRKLVIYSSDNLYNLNVYNSVICLLIYFCKSNIHTPFHLSSHIIHYYVADAGYAGKVNPPGC